MAASGVREINAASAFTSWLTELLTLTRSSNCYKKKCRGKSNGEGSTPPPKCFSRKESSEIDMLESRVLC